MNIQTTGMINIIIFQILIGLSPVVYKLLSAGIPSPAIVGIRWGLGALVLILWQGLSGFSAFKKTYTAKQFGGLLFLGIFGSGIASLFNLIAVRNIGVVLASLLTNLELPLGVVLGVIALGETLTSSYLKASGVIALGFFLLMVKNGITLPLNGSYLLGIGLALCAAMIWGSCTIVGKKLTFSLAPSVVALWRLTLGALINILLVFGSGQSIYSVYQTISPHDWQFLIFLGIVTSGIGFVLYYKALKTLAVHKITLLFTISPVVSVFSGVVFGESPLFSQWLGIGCIFAGLAYLFLKKENV